MDQPFKRTRRVANGPKGDVASMAKKAAYALCGMTVIYMIASGPCDRLETSGTFAALSLKHQCKIVKVDFVDAAQIRLRGISLPESSSLEAVSLALPDSAIGFSFENLFDAVPCFSLCASLGRRRAFGLMAGNAARLQSVWPRAVSVEMDVAKRSVAVWAMLLTTWVGGNPCRSRFERVGGSPLCSPSSRRFPCASAIAFFAFNDGGGVARKSFAHILAIAHVAITANGNSA